MHAISRNERSKFRSNYAVCESTNIPVYLPVDMYGVLQYQARQIFLSICHEGTLHLPRFFVGSPYFSYLRRRFPRIVFNVWIMVIPYNEDNPREATS